MKAEYRIYLLILVASVLWGCETYPVKQEDVSARMKNNEQNENKMEKEEIKPIIVNFPLSGEWCAGNTPGHIVPSHGTDEGGQRYAYDFMQIDWSRDKGFRYFSTPLLRYILFGVRLEEVYCWSQPIFSPFEGIVVEAKDGCRERNPVHFARDLFVVLKNAFLFKAENNDDLQPLLGNYIILKTGNVYALIAHARFGSVKVKQGDKVAAGQMLAEVGHSGNSTAPHLHFQLMDRQDLITAEGLPCSFNEYQVFKNGEWHEVRNGIPGRRERIRNSK